MHNIMKSGLTPVNTKNAVYFMANSDELRGNIRGDSPLEQGQNVCLKLPALTAEGKALR